MSRMEQVHAAFEERNLVLQGLLGLVSAAAAFKDALPPSVHAAEPSPTISDHHPLVLLIMGLASFHEALWAQLDDGLPQGVAAKATSLQEASPVASTPSRLHELMR